MRASRHWLRRLAAAALLCIGGVVSHASSPIGDGWHADPDDQYLLDLNIRQLRLGEGLRGYPIPGGTCLVLGDFLTMLDVPMRIDLQAKRASGWAFREKNLIDIDASANSVRFGDQREALAPGTVRETPEGWCIDSVALSRWFGLGVKVAPYASVVTLESEARLPVELARERALRAKRLRPASLPLESVPEVKLAYRMWRAPALDFIVSAGATYQASSGMRIDRRASLAAAGELAGMSYDATITSGRDQAVGRVRVRAFRSDPEGGMLGPLNATHFAVGDVDGLAHPLLSGQQGRGVEITNKPLFNPASFDRTRFEGALSPGWQAELYRNGQLLGFASDDGAGRYRFEDVALQYGDNRFEIILYGPQGQQRSRIETIAVGPEQIPAGHTQYWLGVNQPGRDILGIAGEYRPPTDPDAFTDAAIVPRLQAAATVAHGVDKHMSVSALAAMMLVGDEKLTFVEGAVRRSIGPALVEGALAKQSNGGLSLRAQALAKLGAVNIAAEALKLDHFYYQGRIEERMVDARLELDAPFKLGESLVGAHGSVRFTDRGGQRRTVAEARLTGNVRAVNLGGGVEWQRDQLGGGLVEERFNLKALASGHVGRVRLRGQGTWEISPSAHLRTAEATAYWTQSDRVDWEVGVGYDADIKRARARLSHVHRFDALAAAATLEAGSDKSFAFGINLNFSLDGSRGGLRATRQPLARSGQISARVFRDNNNNGVHDAGEPLESGALLTAGTAAIVTPSGKDGVARVTGLAPYRAVAIGIDSSSLSDPALTPRKTLQRIVPRPGVDAQVDIALVGAGDVEGVLARSDGAGIEGVDIEVLDEGGKVVATARTDYDGFFLFERLAYGKYSFRIAAASAAAAKLNVAIEASATLSPELTIVRLGTVHATALARLAAN